MIRFFDIIVEIVTTIAIIGLLGSYTAPYIDPNLFYLSSLLGLAYHYLLITNGILLLYWTIRRRRIAIIQIIILAIGYPYMMTYYGMNSVKNSDSDSDFTVLSYNVRQFDRGGWSKQPNGNQKMIRYINSFPGDIACLQEFIRDKKFIAQLNDYPNHHYGGDLAILSRLKIVNSGSVVFAPDASGLAIFSDIVVKHDTVRVYCVHLESYRFGNDERQLFLEFPELKSEELSTSVRSIISHIIIANKARAKQSEILKRHMNNSPYPVILCGDFNDTPISYTYTVLYRGMTDSFIEKGHGVGNTYIGEFPSFRIDHILHDSRLKTTSYIRDTLTLSDHFPISAKLLLTQQCSQ